MWSLQKSPHDVTSDHCSPQGMHIHIDCTNPTSNALFFSKKESYNKRPEKTNKPVIRCASMVHTGIRYVPSLVLIGYYLNSCGRCEISESEIFFSLLAEWSVYDCLAEKLKCYWAVFGWKILAWSAWYLMRFFPIKWVFPHYFACIISQDDSYKEIFQWVCSVGDL